MAKRKRPARPPAASWFFESVRREHALIDKAARTKTDLAYENFLMRAENEAAKRENEKAYLHDSIKLLRRFAHGFEARDGYKLREVASLTGRKLAKVKKLAALIRQEQASPHVEKVVRSKAQRKALESYTGQTDIPGRKRFIVFTEQPEKTAVKVVSRKPKPEPGAEPDEDTKPMRKKRKAKKKPKAVPHVEVEIKVPGGVAREEFFLIADYADDVATFEDVKEALTLMLPEMPKGWYVLVTSNHGNIGVPIQRHRLKDQIESRYMKYDEVPGATSRKDNRGLAEVVVGFKLVSFTKEGAEREYNERLSRRERLTAIRRSEAARRRRARITGRR